MIERHVNNHFSLTHVLLYSANATAYSQKKQQNLTTNSTEPDHDQQYKGQSSRPCNNVTPRPNNTLHNISKVFTFSLQRHKLIIFLEVWHQLIILTRTIKRTLGKKGKRDPIILCFSKINPNSIWALMQHWSLPEYWGKISSRSVIIDSWFMLTKLGFEEKAVNGRWKILALTKSGDLTLQYTNRKKILICKGWASYIHCPIDLTF